jgi:hypothetical protein
MASRSSPLRTSHATAGVRSMTATTSLSQRPTLTGVGLRTLSSNFTGSAVGNLSIVER